MKKFSMLAFCCFAALAAAGPKAEKARTERLPLPELRYRYKQIDTVSLCIYVYKPAKAAAPTPAIVFFFGGGWNSGDVRQFMTQAEYFAARGMTAILADYRTFKRAGTPPPVAVTDARSAMRYVRSHAAELGVDPARIVASGGSAGGHLAAATAYVTAFDDAADDLAISPAPDALALFNPVIDNSEEGYGYDRVKERWRQFSPMHNITVANVRPTLFMLGDGDKLIPVATARRFEQICVEAGGRCDVKIYEGAGHGFFNYGNRRKAGSPDFYVMTLKDADDFLVSLGYLPPVRTSKPARDKK
jgi:acetyl esterase/lipase